MLHQRHIWPLLGKLWQPQLVELRQQLRSHLASGILGASSSALARPFCIIGGAVVENGLVVINRNSSVLSFFSWCFFGEVLWHLCRMTTTYRIVLIMCTYVLNLSFLDLWNRWSEWSNGVRFANHKLLLMHKNDKFIWLGSEGEDRESAY